MVKFNINGWWFYISNVSLDVNRKLIYICLYILYVCIYICM